MDNNVFDGLVVFCAVVEQGGFTAGAKTLAHTTSYVSKEVSRLENRLGTRLLNRTTRKISLTEAGQIYFENSRRILDEARASNSQILNAKERPFGHLKVSVPVMFGDVCLNQWLPEFVEAYPDISHEVQVNDRFVDIVAEGFDVVVRAGQLDNADHIAKRLMSTRRLTVASREYLEAKGEPNKPHELKGHVLVDFSYRGISNIWEYQNPGGKPFSVKVEPKIRCNSASMEVELASSGFGITRIPQLAAEQQIRSGKLVPILEDYENPPLDFYAIYPSRKHLAPKVRVFVDFLVRKCKQND